MHNDRHDRREIAAKRRGYSPSVPMRLLALVSLRTEGYDRFESIPRRNNMVCTVFRTGFHFTGHLFLGNPQIIKSSCISYNHLLYWINKHYSLGGSNMSDPKITYFPVGNGDTSLIRLSDKTDIIIDCNIIQESKDDSEETHYDVRSHLQKVLKKKDEGPSYVDVFILTHPDHDHCLGFSETFYIGNPSLYSESDKQNGLILIDELWFSPRIFSPHEEELCDQAKEFRKEAKRRMKLYKDNLAERSNPGNRLRIIGYSDNPELDGLEAITTSAGEYLNLINGSIKSDFTFFVHAPFRKETDSEWAKRNDTSVVLHAQFTVDNQVRAGLAFFGGDAGCAIWEEILINSTDENLEWDIFLSPHHCSWSFFSELPYKDNQVPSEKSLELLRKKRGDAIVVASCKPIKDDDDNPPHFAAANEYKNVVGEDQFYATMEYPDEENPLPLEFEFSKNGPVKVDSIEAGVITSSAAIQDTIGTPKTYGR